MHKLSAREYDVLALVDQGWSDAEIAERLSISIWTSAPICVVVLAS